MNSIGKMYNETHSQIKKSIGLLKEILEIVNNPKNRNLDKYICTGLKIDDVYLGIDFKKRHVEKFPTILMNTQILYEISHYKADFSRILLKIVVDGVHIANLTEDVSRDGDREIFDQGTTFGPYLDYLNTVFRSHVEKAVFIVYNSMYVDDLQHSKGRKKVLNPPLRPIRMVLIGLSHMTLLPIFRSFYKEPNDEELKNYTLEYKV